MKTDEKLNAISWPGELLALSEDEIHRLVAISKRTLTAGDLLDELRRRQAARSERTMRRLTWAITILTAVVSIATVVNLMTFLASAPPGFITF